MKPLNSENAEALSKLRQLTLSTEAVLAREEERGVADAPFIIKRPYEIITGIIDWLFADKNPIARFYFLETVARVPYYSYISMIHTYETLGWWRRSTAMKRIHFAQEYNELHHLMIWEGTPIPLTYISPRCNYLRPSALLCVQRWAATRTGSSASARNTPRSSPSTSSSSCGACRPSGLIISASY